MTGRAKGERGVGTLLTAGVALVLLSVTWGVCLVLGWWLQASRAQDAADLAALAGAAAMAEQQDACAAAGLAARNNGARLSACRLTSEGSAFVVEVRVVLGLHPALPGGPAAVERSASAGTPAWE